MAEPPLARHSSSPAELQARLAAARAGLPHLIYRDDTGTQHVVELQPDGRDVLTIGRGSRCAICVGWDGEVSRVHAELRLAGTSWAIEDNGLSRNGTFVNGTRISGRRRLVDGDALRVGQTVFAYCAPEVTEASGTLEAGEVPLSADITPAQRRVLVALCRPYAGESGYASPATNNAIAAELHLSVETVKTQIRELFRRFGVEELPRNQKRTRLVELAFRSGIVSQRDLA